MNWELAIAIIIAVPIILFPAVYLWYINIGGVYETIKEARGKRIARQQLGKDVVNIK